MSLNTSPLLSLLVLLSLITPNAQRSSGAKFPGKQDEPKLDANQPPQNNAASSKQRSLALLDELIVQTKNFSPDLFRSFRISLIQADIADLLWDYDQARARSLFETAFKTAGTMRPRANGGRAQNSPIATTHLEVEKEILEYVLVRDVRFAEALVTFALKTAEAAGPNGTEPDWAYRSEQAILYSQIARRVAATEPPRAAELVRASFNGWFGADQVIALNSLRRQAPKLSDEIFLYALTLLREKPTNLSNKVSILAAYAFPEINIQTNFYIRKTGGSPDQPKASPAVRKAFLEFVYETFMQQTVASQTAENSGFGTASFAGSAMRELLSRFDQELPDKAPAIRSRVQEVITSIKKAGRQDMLEAESEAFSKAFRGNVQELIHKAEAATDQTEKDQLYREAAGLLVYQDGDLDQALSLLGKVSEGTVKSSLIAEIRQARAETAINDGDPDKAYVYSRDVQDVELRSDLLTRIARLFGNRGKRERAKAVWGEALQAANGLEAGWGQIDEMLKLVTVATEIHPEMGFEAMKATIDAINSSNGSPTNGVYSHGAGEKFKFFGRFDFDENVGLLARVDFARVLQLSRSIKLSEVATLLQLAACKGVLRKNN